MKYKWCTAISSWATVVDTSHYSFVKIWVLFTHKCFVNVLIFTIYVKLIDDNVPLEKDTAQSWIPFIQEGFVVKWNWSNDSEAF